jgi:hypothetical protein
VKATKEVTPAEITLAELGVKFENVEDKVDNLGKRVSAQSGKITRMSNKVNNGFGEAISAVKDQVNFNTKAIGKIVWFGATTAVLIFLSLLGIFASIWLHDRSEVRELAPIEMSIDGSEDGP